MTRASTAWWCAISATGASERAACSADLLALAGACGVAVSKLGKAAAAVAVVAARAELGVGRGGCGLGRACTAGNGEHRGEHEGSDDELLHGEPPAATIAELTRAHTPRARERSERGSVRRRSAARGRVGA